VASIPQSSSTCSTFGRAAATVVLVIAIGACGHEEGPVEVVLWTWSTGERLAETTRLVSRFNDGQAGITVRAVPWPVEAVEAPTGLPFVEALAAKRRPSDVPSLIEAPEEALVAIVEADLSRDMSGSFADQLGLRFDDFQPWLMPQARIRGEGIAGVPLYHDVPLVVTKEGSGLAERVRASGLDGLVGTGAATPLAAPADYRIFLWALDRTGGLAVPEGEVDATLDLAKAREAVDLLRTLLGSGAADRGGRGERRALEEVAGGGASAALVWSSSLGTTALPGLAVSRAPLRTRGTFLVVHARAQWRQRQAALRVARWMTEPLQASALANRLWLAPIRASVARGAAYGAAEGPPAWRREVAAPDRPTRLPARGAFVDALVSDLEPALRTLNFGGGLLERLQSTLRERVLDGRGQMSDQSTRGEGS
jgi:hypothetical protein